MPRHGTPRLIVFDSGLGGLTVLRALREAVPEARITYIADDAYFPYGALADDTLIARVLEAVGGAIAELVPDAVVIACNTASTVVMTHLRAAHTLPFIGTVPAVKPAAMLSQSCMISVLGTPATVTRDYTRALIAAHGEGCEYTLVGAARLAAIAETVMSGGEAADAEIAAEIAPCFTENQGRRTDVVVLGCTHYPLVEHLFRAALPPETRIVSQPLRSAEALTAYLFRHPEMKSFSATAPEIRGYTTGDPARVTALASTFYQGHLAFESLPRHLIGMRQYA